MICFIILDVSFGVCTLRSFFLEKKNLACQSFTAALEGDRVRVGWAMPRRFANAVS